ncbi:MAG: restriction endonuclease subunit S, partial [Fusobacteriaceae bacterium]
IKKKFEIPQKGDILLTSVGTIGVPYLINNNHPFYFKDGNITWIKKYKTEVYNKYIYQWIKSPLGQNQINQVTIGSTQKALTIDALKKLELNLPPLETQEKIASILSALDDKIEINNEMNKTLEEMAQTLFKRWFIDFDFQNENGEPYRSSGGKMIDSELGEIPEGWRIGSLEEVIDKIIDNRGKTPPRTEVGIPLIEGNNIFLNEMTPILNSKQKYVSEETYSSWFRAGHPEYLDILCATVGTLPKWCFTPKNTKICIAQNIVAIRSNDLISPYYLKMYIDTGNFIKRFEGRIIATAQPSIKVGHLTSLLIIIPIKKVINDFDKIIENIFKKREKNQQEIQSLIQIRDTLLPKLMSGEIEV